MASEAPVLVDDESARRVIFAFNRQGVQIPVDWEHATVVKGERGEAAPAAGWITAIEWVPGKGIYGTVSWTATAREQIAAGGYKYLSPVMLIEMATRRVSRIESVALTNRPRIKSQRENYNRV